MPTPQREATNVTHLLQDPDWTPPVIRVLYLSETERAKRLRQWCSFAEGTQHDHLQTNWNGGYRDPGVQYMHERLEPQGFVPTSSVPYGDRRPDTPDPLAPQIVRRFADVLVGDGAFPTLVTPADVRTARYLAAFFDSANLQSTFHEARMQSGACGEAAILIEVIDGTPTSSVMETADLEVLRWKYSGDWIPEAVVEQRLVTKTVESVDPGGRIKRERKRFWRTRYWDDLVSVEFEDVPEDYGSKPEDRDEAGNVKPIPIATDEDGDPKVVEHRAGRCPVIWLQNTRNSKAPCGTPDLVNQQTVELCDKHDRVSSMATRATIAGTDPTLVLKRDRMTQRRGGLVRKGYGARLEVGEKGDAKFLEITGETITVAWQTAERLRDMVLRACACVLIDPKTSGDEKSGEAVQMLWRSMDDRCDAYRVPLRTAIVEAAHVAIHLGKEWGVGVADGPEADDDQGGIILPPYAEESDDPETENADPKLKRHEVGNGWHVILHWPAYHRPTPLQVQTIATALSTATGQRPVISQRTGIEVMGGVLGRMDAAEEERRIAAEQEKRMATMEGMLNPPGGGKDDDPPAGGKAEDDRAGKPGDDGKAKEDGNDS